MLTWQQRAEGVAEAPVTERKQRLLQMKEVVEADPESLRHTLGRCGLDPCTLCKFLPPLSGSDMIKSKTSDLSQTSLSRDALPHVP